MCLIFCIDCIDCTETTENSKCSGRHDWNFGLDMRLVYVDRCDYFYFLNWAIKWLRWIRGDRRVRDWDCWRCVGLNNGLTIEWKWGWMWFCLGDLRFGGDGFWSYFCADFGWERDVFGGGLWFRRMFLPI